MTAQTGQYPLRARIHTSVRKPDFPFEIYNDCYVRQTDHILGPTTVLGTDFYPSDLEILCLYETSRFVKPVSG
jgi:hypothetical protein